MAGVVKMYQEEYKRWLAADLEDADLNPELSRIEGNDEEIKDRFAVALKFGTAGLRGVLGAGTNRMNIYVVRQATQGLANWVKTQGGNQTVAISYDSRLKSDVFAKNAAGVLAANGIKVRIYDALMPVPALSFATRYYECNAGIMVTASHNPAKYNGYKAYGPDGCQMTDDAAAIVYDEIQKTDVLTGAKYMSFAEGVEEGLIRFVGDDCKQALYEAIESRQVRPGLCKTAGLKLVYSPLNGSGLVPVTQVLKDIGITDITIVPEQEYPNGYFTTIEHGHVRALFHVELERVGVIHIIDRVAVGQHDVFLTGEAQIGAVGFERVQQTGINAHVLAGQERRQHHKTLLAVQIPLAAGTDVIHQRRIILLGNHADVLDAAVHQIGRAHV